LLDPLPLQVAARVVGVGMAFAVRERVHSAGICIIREVPERGSPETIVIMRSFNDRLAEVFARRDAAEFLRELCG